MSKVAINVVIKGLQELLPFGSTTSLTSLQSKLTSDFTVPENMIDKTYDAERLRVVVGELVSCKEDSQQRSWELYEDEEVISEYLNELISILVSLNSCLFMLYNVFLNVYFVSVIAVY